MGFGIILQNFNDTIASFGGALTTFANPAGGIKTHSYIHKEGVTNRIKPQNWKLSLPYSFKVVGVSSPLYGANSPLSGLGNILGPSSGGGLFDELTLPLNPSAISQSEKFSIVNTATQRGVVSEHNGVVFKNLVISGTTGMRPDPYKSGYEWLQEIRNYFRAYAEFKKDPNQKEAQLVFINRKDNEWLIVEPEDFTVERTAGSAFMYNYRITLRVIGSRGPIVAGGFLGDFFAEVDGIIDTATDYIYGARNLFYTSIATINALNRDFINTILGPIEAIGITLKTAKGLPITLADLPTNFINELSVRTKTAILDDALQAKRNGNIRFLDIQFPPSNKLEVEQLGTAALDSIPYEARRIMPISFLSTEENQKLVSIIPNIEDIPKKFYSDLLENAISARDDAAEKFGIDLNSYNDFIGRKNVFNVDESRNPTDEEIAILHGFYKLEKGINLILATDLLFRNDYQSDIEDIRLNFDDKFVINQPVSGIEIRLPTNTTLEDLASEYLGNPNRWVEIVISNNLKFPYIQENSDNRFVKSPGDKILIPQQTASDFSQVPLTKRYPINEGFDETERNLGVDLKVDKNFDLIINNANDLSLISGSKNAAQAVILSLYLQKGTNKYHPTKGTDLQIGEKAVKANDVRDDIFISILSDQRFSSISDLTFLDRGNGYNISFNLAIKSVSTPIPITVQL